MTLYLCHRSKVNAKLLKISISQNNMGRFYARTQLLLSARLSHRNSVCLSVCLSVCHTGGSVKNGES